MTQCPWPTFYTQWLCHNFMSTIVFKSISLHPWYLKPSNHLSCLSLMFLYSMHNDLVSSVQFLCAITVLETAGRIVAKCDQTLVWATKFFPKDRPENEFGRPNLGRGYRMFSAYLRSISEINIFKTDQRTWGNNIVFLPKEAAIILTGSLRFSATCCLILFSKKTFSGIRLTL